MRALISYEFDQGFDSCAESVKTFLESQFEDEFSEVELTHDLSRARLLGEGSSVDNPVPNRSSAENFGLVIHIGHGAPGHFNLGTRFKDSYGKWRPETVSLSEFSPGSRSLRHVWLISCNVLEHGQTPHDPESITESSPSNVFSRLHPSGGRPSAVTGGLRLLCGSSTVIFVHAQLLSPVLRLIRQGFRFSDSFLLGLTTDTQVPLCSTAGILDHNATPLADQASWDGERNIPQERHPREATYIHLQYLELQPIGETTHTLRPLEEAGPTEDVENQDPADLPVLQLSLDYHALENFHEIEGKAYYSDGVEALADSDTGTLSLYARGPSPSTFEVDENFLARQQAVMRGALDRSRSLDLRVDSRTLRLSRTFDRVMTRRLQAYPLSTAQETSALKFDISSLQRDSGQQYRVRYVYLRDTVNDADYQILDPDYVDIQDVAVLSRTAALPPPLSRLLLRRLTLSDVKDGNREVRVSLIQRKVATEIARDRIVNGTSIHRDKVDISKAHVRIGYRRYHRGAGLGTMLPHYIVSFPEDESTAHAGFTVEVEGADDPTASNFL